MLYRKLGSTGLMVSEVGFGTIPVLRGGVPVLPKYYNLTDEQALAVMGHAFDLGCNLYDTAIVPEYGDAERKLGIFASGDRREKIIISDKARFFDGNEMYMAVLESCENLGTWPDIYFVHQADWDHEEEIFRKGGALDALCQLKEEGRIRFTGLASHYYDILLRGAKDPRVDVLQGSGNLLERGMLDRIRKEPAFDPKGLLINKVYAAGILPDFLPTETLVRSVLSYPISSALIGIGTVEQADAAFIRDPGYILTVDKIFQFPHGTCCGHATCEKENPIDREYTCSIPDFEQVLSILEKDFAPIPCDRCQRCRCLHGTEIHTVFRQYNYFFLGKDHWALRKLKQGIQESARLCRKCTDMPCLAMCPRKIRIPDEILKVARLVEKYESESFMIV